MQNTQPQEGSLGSGGWGGCRSCRVGGARSQLLALVPTLGPQQEKRAVPLTSWVHLSVQ